MCRLAGWPVAGWLVTWLAGRMAHITERHKVLCKLWWWKTTTKLHLIAKPLGCNYSIRIMISSNKMANGLFYFLEHNWLISICHCKLMANIKNYVTIFQCKYVCIKLARENWQYALSMQVSLGELHCAITSQHLTSFCCCRKNTAIPWARHP